MPIPSVRKKDLEREKDDIEGFSAEVAWVTKVYVCLKYLFHTEHINNLSGFLRWSSDLEEPIAIHPTSDSVMYQRTAKWFKLDRDIWNSIIRC